MYVSDVKNFSAHRNDVTSCNHIRRRSKLIPWYQNISSRDSAAWETTNGPGSSILHPFLVISFLLLAFSSHSLLSQCFLPFYCSLLVFFFRSSVVETPMCTEVNILRARLFRRQENGTGATVASLPVYAAMAIPTSEFSHLPAYRVTDVPGRIVPPGTTAENKRFSALFLVRNTVRGWCGSSLRPADRVPRVMRHLPPEQPTDYPRRDLRTPERFFFHSIKSSRSPSYTQESDAIDTHL